MPLTTTSPFDATLELRIPNRKAYDIRTLSWGTGVNVADLTISARSNNPTVARVTERAFRNFLTISALALDSGAVTRSTARIVIDVTDAADGTMRQYTIAVTVVPTQVLLPPSDIPDGVTTPDDLTGNTVRGVDVYSGQTTTLSLHPYTSAGAWVLTSNTPAVTVGARANTSRSVSITGGNASGEYAVELTKGTEVLTITGHVLAVPPVQSVAVEQARQIRLAAGQTYRLPLSQYHWDMLTGDSDIELSDLDFVSQLDTYDRNLVFVSMGANNAYIQFSALNPGTLRNGARWNVLDGDDNFLGTFVVPVAIRNVHGVVPAPPPRPRGPAEAPLPVEPIEDPEADAADIDDRPAIVLPSTDRWILAHRSVGKVSEVKLEQGILSFRCDDAHVIKGSKDNKATVALAGPFRFIGRYSVDGIDVAWPQSVKDQIEQARG